ncbi:M1 family peptidase [Cytophagales bacterium RKSG123]|nr:M1 family peptidase [Xanthovirga aplysinae]
MQIFTHADSLRGQLSPLRRAYKVYFYDLNLRINPSSKSIKGYNDIYFTAQSTFDRIQVDLFENMIIDQIIFKDQKLDFQRDGNAFFVEFPEKVNKGSIGNLRIYYHGQPLEASNPPWEGGFSWSKDEKGRDWIGVSCEGLGASLWWPNKDHPTAKPDSMSITIEVPSPLMEVSNGQLRNVIPLQDGYTRFQWFVTYPINNYNVTLNAAHYAHFSDTYTALDGDKIPLDYYVLDYNLDKAKKHFKQTQGMLQCFEELYGKYPFPRDGYGLVETPYWGMEHQGAIAYGNNYKNNSFGFDFILIHESGHEYWGNSVTESDHAEMWIHEAFTTYSDALYIECRFSYGKFLTYMQDMKSKIANREPILAPMGVNYNFWNDSDMYYKGAWMLHSIRNTIDNEEEWFALLFNLYQNFKYSNVSSDDIIDFLDENTKYNLRPIFRQFLLGVDPPKLIYSVQQKGKTAKLKFKWETDYAWDFNMPMKVKFGTGKYYTIYPTNKWQTENFNTQKADRIKFADELFYFELEKNRE